jgi:hypothetical protein
MSIVNHRNQYRYQKEAVSIRALAALSAGYYQENRLSDFVVNRSGEVVP